LKSKAFSRLTDTLSVDVPWWTVENVGDIPSPALFLYPDRAEENLQRMIAIAGGVARLRPHTKTHKLAPLVDSHVALGITRFKCATIAEAEMVAAAGASDVLLAYQPVGPNITRLCVLAAAFPRTRFSGLVDDDRTAAAVSDAAAQERVSLGLWLDLDVGMHRTGVLPGPDADRLYRRMATLPSITPRGLHAYDGHLRDRDPETRAAKVDEAFAPVAALRAALLADALPVPSVVAGGTPTFAIHARRSGVDLSPGTSVLWDGGYATQLPDLDFLSAALVLTRVVSKPGGDRVCIDLGYKAIASEGPHPRVLLIQPDSVPWPARTSVLGAPILDATFVGHSEEHLVFESPAAGSLGVGDALYGIPWHVCPTVALHSEAVVARDHRAVDRWRITARERRLTI
jgi:D-serine deaminase-like pyridoxal phosphate-dependent protein